MPIDWAATGSMLGGWSTLAGAVAIIYAARVGANTFDSWKRQKQEERRMDAAERIMTLAYRLRYNLEAIRSPLLRSHELAQAQSYLETAHADWWNGLLEKQQKKATMAQVYKQRLTHFDDEAQEVWTLKPLARAFFGPEVEQRIHDLWQAHVKVRAAAEAYEDDYGDDKEFSRQLRLDLSTSGEPNPVNESIAVAITALEFDLLPVIRSDAWKAAPSARTARESAGAGLNVAREERDMGDDRDKKTWTPQEGPRNVPGAKPSRDREPPAESPKPEKRK